MQENKVVLATCYGASNTGQLAGAVATELAKENEGYSLVCLPAVAIDKDSGLSKIAGANVLVVIERCPVTCCTKIIEQHAGKAPDIRVEMVQDYGVKKNSSLEYDLEQKERIEADVKAQIERKLVEQN